MSSGKSRRYELLTRFLAVPLVLCGLWYFVRGFKPTINHWGKPRTEAVFALICFALAVPIARGRRRSEIDPRS